MGIKIPNENGHFWGGYTPARCNIPMHGCLPHCSSAVADKCACLDKCICRCEDWQDSDVTFCWITLDTGFPFSAYNFIQCWLSNRQGSQPVKRVSFSPRTSWAKNWEEPINPGSVGKMATKTTEENAHQNVRNKKRLHQSNKHVCMCKITCCNSTKKTYLESSQLRRKFIVDFQATIKVYRYTLCLYRAGSFCK